MSESGQENPPVKPPGELSSRRDFLKKVGALGAAAAAVGIGTKLTGESQSAPAEIDEPERITTGESMYRNEALVRHYGSQISYDFTNYDNDIYGRINRAYFAGPTPTNLDGTVVNFSKLKLDENDTSMLPDSGDITIPREASIAQGGRILVFPEPFADFTKVTTVSVAELQKEDPYGVDVFGEQYAFMNSDGDLFQSTVMVRAGDRLLPSGAWVQLLNYQGRPLKANSSFGKAYIPRIYASTMIHARLNSEKPPTEEYEPPITVNQTINKSSSGEHTESTKSD